MSTRAIGGSLVRWFDSWAGTTPDSDDDRAIDWLRVVPFLILHLACALVLLVGWSPFAAAFAVGFFILRMFAITGFYHRYFSHRTFQTSRALQFAFAVLGSMAVQRGPLWWAAHHRNHHRRSDRSGDAHSPVREGLLHSHVGWIVSRGNFRTRTELVPDLMRFPELRFLDRFDVLVPLLTLAALFALGQGLAAWAPGLGTSGFQLVVYGFVLSTVALYHGTFTINSLAHRFGSRRYATGDDSRNNLWLSLLTLGEGWHNNHHHYPNAVRQGFFWWEIDVTYYLLRALAALGLIWDLRPVPERVLPRTEP